MSDVRAEGGADVWVHVVGDAVALADVLDDRDERSVKGMRELGEEVVNDLEVEPPEPPGEQPVVGAEVDRGLYLVDRPFDALVRCGELLGGGVGSLIDT